jgi:hypothetical protein
VKSKWLSEAVPHFIGHVCATAALSAFAVIIPSTPAGSARECLPPSMIVLTIDDGSAAHKKTHRRQVELGIGEFEIKRRSR